MSMDILDAIGVKKMIANPPRVGRRNGGFTMRSADAAYGLIVAAGQGDAQAKGQLDAIKASAANGEAAGVKLMAYITPIAKMVALNLGPPSSLAKVSAEVGALHLSPQELTMYKRLPPESRARLKNMSDANAHAFLQRGIVTAHTFLQRGKGSTQNIALQKAQSQIKAMRQAQITNMQKQALINKTKQRIQQEQAKAQALFAQQQVKYDTEIQAYDDKLVAVQKELEKRDWDDETRKRLEEQAAGYEDMIDKLKTAKASGAEAAAASATAAAAAVETAQASAVEPAQPAADEAEATAEEPSGAPGDVEITE